MRGRDFFDMVAEHAELEWLGVHERPAPVTGPEAPPPEILVRHVNRDVKYALSLQAVLEHSWEELEAVLTGRRRANIMTHLSRIVGYFSRIQNWNRSKLAELRDRHAGDYALPEKGPRREEQPAVA
jgi:hypothetical protein